MKYFNRILAYGIVPLLVITVATVVDAQACKQGELCSPLSPAINSPRAFVAAVLRVVVIIALPFLSLAFVWTGFLFVSALGSTEKIKTAKNAFLYTVLGAIAILGAWQAALLLEAAAKQVTG